MEKYIVVYKGDLLIGIFKDGEIHLSKDVKAKEFDSKPAADQFVVDNNLKTWKK